MHLISVIDDTLDVYEERTLRGQIVLMSEGWAAYRATLTGRIVEKRIGTYKTTMLAVMALKCDHEWFDEDGYRICAHCGVGSPELGYKRVESGEAK
jgi:hypothetical protein